MNTRQYHATDLLRCGEIFYSHSHVELSCTPQYALVYISQGRARYSCGGRETELGPGIAFQRFPEAEHSVNYERGTRTHYVAVPAEVLRCWQMLKLPMLDSHFLELGLRCGFVARQRSLHEQLLREAPQLQARVLTVMQELIVDMHILAYRSSGEEKALIGEACTLLSQNLARDEPLEELAVRLGMGYSSFRQKFKQICGVGPGTYRLRKRIERAGQLLLAGRRVGEVAEELGYPDIYAFSAQFKKMVGQSPQQYARDYHS